MRYPRDKDKLILEGKIPHLARVYLDGELVSSVYEVDDEEGWVTTISFDADRVKIIGQRRHGEVKILFPGPEE